MYWYYKYPLLALLILVVGGGAWLVFGRSPAPKGSASSAPASVPPVLSAEKPAPAPEKAVPVPVAEKPAPVSATPLEKVAEKPAAEKVPAIKNPDGVTPPPAVKKPVSPAIAAALKQMAALEEARKLLADGFYQKAREKAATILESPGVVMFDDTWKAAAAVVSAANTKFITTDLVCPEKRPYTVAKGDVLIRLAYKNGTTVDQIRKNNPSMRVIQPGQVLNLLPGDGFSLVAYKSQYTLLLLNQGKLFKTYRISIGRENRTPVGTFVIDDKVPEPPFRDIPYTGNGDQGNELGTRWLRLKASGATPATLVGYGIHGTWEPDSIGKAASNGCLRLSNEEVEELYDLLPSKPGVISVEIKD